MFKHFSDFTYASKEAFPAESCTEQDAREKDVFLSPDLYEVLYIDKRFPKGKNVAFARPYVCRDKDGSATYGWTTEDGKDVLGNIENSCNVLCNDEFVVGFVKATDEDIKESEEEAAKFLKAIEDQM